MRLTERRARMLCEEWLPGWHWVGPARLPPDRAAVLDCRSADEWVGDEWVGAYLDTRCGFAGLHAACATAMKLYKERMADKRAAMREPQASADWSFTASASNPPHLGRILKEARESGIKLLRVRCGGASRVFVSRELWSAVIGSVRAKLSGLSMVPVDETDCGRITTEVVTALSDVCGQCTDHLWCMLQGSSAEEQRIIDACRKHLEQRREVRVEVLA